MATCFANPSNPDHKEWSCRLRIEDCKRMNIPIPECLKAFAEEEEKKRQTPMTGGGEAPKQMNAWENLDANDPRILSAGEDLQALCEEG
jgi:hypothetical protein